MITSQVAEDLFNRGKASLAVSKNERINCEHLTAVCVDKRVLSKVHRYDEVDRTTAQHRRNPQLNAHCFQAPLTKQTMPAEQPTKINV